MSLNEVKDDAQERGGFKNFRHKFAYDDVMFLRDKLDLLTEWEAEFVLGILENERLSSTVCRLSEREFRKLQEIRMDVKKRNARPEQPGRRLFSLGDEA